MIYKGQSFKVKYQSMTISPVTIKVTVVWVGPDRVHYRKEGYSKVYETSIDRFMEIVSQ